jgi:hypothetical protein
VAERVPYRQPPPTPAPKAPWMPRPSPVPAPFAISPMWRQALLEIVVVLVLAGLVFGLGFFAGVAVAHG